VEALKTAFRMHMKNDKRADARVKHTRVEDRNERVPDRSAIDRVMESGTMKYLRTRILEAGMYSRHFTIKSVCFVE
jgi:hypothetical protein